MSEPTNPSTTWDGDTYVAVERLLFDVDSVLKRMVGWSGKPDVPDTTRVVLRQAWNIGLDMARVLYDEQQRLVQAKVEYDLLGGHR